MASTKRLQTTFSSPSSAEKIAINDDLLLQILVNLPIKSLLKFKSVSKHWLSRITNPHFSRRGYLSHSPCICGLFLHYWSRASYQFEFISLHCKHFNTLSSVNYPSHMKIIQSCNGLLLCCEIPLHRSAIALMYYVCNPTSKQYTALPPLIQIGKICGVFLAFDPRKSPDYKVICLRRYEIKGPDYQIEIHSSKSGSWRLSEAHFCLDSDIGIHGGVFWNGGIHWYTDSGPCFYFDVEEERIGELPMPNPIPDKPRRRRVMYFGESRGHLYLVEIYDPPSTQFDVWELQKDYSGWSPKYRVNLDGLVSAGEYPGMKIEFNDSLELDSYVYDSLELDSYVYEVYSIVEGESEEDSYMVLHIPANIIRYDFNTQFVTKLCDFPPPSPSSSSSENYRKDESAAGFYYSGAHQYIESLVRV